MTLWNGMPSRKQDRMRDFPYCILETRFCEEWLFISFQCRNGKPVSVKPTGLENVSPLSLYFLITATGPCAEACLCHVFVAGGFYRSEVTDPLLSLMSNHSKV